MGVPEVVGDTEAVNVTDCPATEFRAELITVVVVPAWVIVSVPLIAVTL